MQKFSSQSQKTARRGFLPHLPRSDHRLLEINHLLASGALHSTEISHLPGRLRCLHCHLGEGLYEPGHVMSLHHHAAIQMEVALTGSFLVKVGQKKNVLQPGDALIIRDQVPHQWMTTEGGFLLGLLIGTNLDGGFRSERSCLPQSRHLPNTQETHALLNGLVSEFSLLSSGELGATRVAAWLSLLFSHWLPPYFGNSSPGGRDHADVRGEIVIAQARAFIRENLRSTLRTEEIASRMGMSGRQVSRLFTAHFGTSLHQHVLQIRLNTAREMLGADSGCSVKQAAYECGFSSPSHLAMAFRKAFLISPSDYARTSNPCKQNPDRKPKLPSSGFSPANRSDQTR